MKDLKSALRKSKTEVTFTKKDGSTRVMNCTLNFELIKESYPEFEKPKGTSKQKTNSEQRCTVWDLEANAWRSFYVDSVQTFTLI